MNTKKTSKTRDEFDFTYEDGKVSFISCWEPTDDGMVMIEFPAPGIDEEVARNIREKFPTVTKGVGKFTRLGNGQSKINFWEAQDA
jgi:hypothetical protein